MDVRRFAGLFSLLLIGAALCTALVAVGLGSPLAAVIYLFVLVAGSAFALHSYCAKCPEREGGCAHVVPGYLTRFLPKREEGPYTRKDFSVFFLASALMLLFPQPWLLARGELFLVFWVLLAVALTEIWFFVCLGCQNRNCPMQPRKNPPQKSE